MAFKVMKNKLIRAAFAAALSATLLVPTVASACTTVLVGKNASTDGSTFIARNEDSMTAWPKYFLVHEAKNNPAGTMYKSTGNNFTCELPAHAYKYTATPENDESEGQFEEAGINEKGVAMSATESGSYNDKIAKADPLVEDTGIGEDSMVTAVLPYISTAREGVERLGALVEKYGSAEVNGVAFSDKDEVWYMEIGSGHHWVARRIPDNYYAVVANQIAIQKIDFNDTKHFMWSTGLQEFVKKNNLNPAKSGFNFREIFGTNDKDDLTYNIPRVWYGQKVLSPSQVENQKIDSTTIPFYRKPDKKIDKDAIAKVLSSHFNDTKYDSYGKNEGSLRPISVPRTMESHIIQFRQNMPVEISGVQWVALGVPETSVYVPFYAGITQTPEAYRTGTATPSDDSAYWAFRTTNALVRPQYKALMPTVTPVMNNVTHKLNQNLKASDEEAMKIYNNNPLDKTALQKYLTEQGEKNATYAIDEFKALNAQLIKQYTALNPIYHNSDL
ncbi:C69 family dipeptidase [Velocimicrobium porci]|nr:C69 family dipeptidase [Velocimicrobium porci]